MKLTEIQAGPSIKGFTNQKTGMPMYDDMLRLPEYFRREKGLSFHVSNQWTPEKYLERCAEGFKSTVERLNQTRDEELVDEYADKMMKREKFPMLVIDYSNGFRQEGIHRALAAQKIGIQKLPVMIVNKA